MDRPGEREPVALLDLIEPASWQRLQDHFSSVLGVTIRTVGPAHELLVTPSWPSGIAPDRVIQLLRIGEELDELIPPGEAPTGPATLTTSLGLTYAQVPIRVTEERAVAWVIVGPVIVGPREEAAAFWRRASALGIDAQALWPVILSLKPYTFAGINSVLRLLEEVGTSLAQLAYRSRRLETILSPKGRVADQAMVMEHTDRVLRALLKTATIATKAEGGSVMLLDPQGERFGIAAAEGLSESVVACTSPRRHEGLAGLALERGGVLLINEQAADSAMRARMHRPEVQSSLVAPLLSRPRPTPIGVLSLRTSNRTQPFTQEHAELLGSLVDLTSTALAGLLT